MIRTALFTLMFLPCISFGQVFLGNMTLTTQQEVDDFNFTIIAGDLLIGNHNNPSDINDLSPLALLQSVSGTLSIENTQLSQLSGLEQLAWTGTLNVVSNYQLENISHLSGLTEPGGLIIGVNPLLTSLNGLEGITSIRGIVDIEGNNALVSLDGLNNLEHIGSWVVIDENPQLTDLKALQNLQSVGEFLRIGPDLPLLENLEGLEGLEWINSELIITGNDGLKTLEGLNNIQSIQNKITIADNPLLDDCCAIARLITKTSEIPAISGNGSNCNNTNSIFEFCSNENVLFANLSFSTQEEVNAFTYSEIYGTLTVGAYEGPLTDIHDLTPLSSLKVVDNRLNIAHTQVVDLNGLHNLTTAGGLEILNNPNLASLQGLEGIQSVPGWVIIQDNQALPNLQGLDNLGGVGHELVIRRNNGLVDFTGLENLHGLDGSFQIVDNPGLVSVNGLDQLGHILGNLVITNNDNLETLSGFTRLTTINGVLIIRENENLEELIFNILFGAEELQVIENPKLTSLKGLEQGGFSKITIEGNSSLINLEGLEHNESVDALIISGNQSLHSLKGLDNIVTSSNLEVIFNPQLKDLSGLGKMTTAIDIIIEGNAGLTSLKGMNISAVKSLFNISENSSLKTLEGLENLKAVEDALVIAENPQLNSLAALGQLDFVFSLLIYDNPSLPNLQGLQNLTGLRELGIFNNIALSDCCTLSKLLSERTLDETTIHSNGQNCNSLNLILQNCNQLTSGFTLVDGTTDMDIMDLDPTNVPEIINLLETGHDLNIRANFPEVVESVVFTLDGNPVATENVFPFALFGNNPPNDYFSGNLPLGRHMLTATPYSMTNGKGVPGTTQTIELLVVEDALAVTGFTLVDSNDNSDIMELTDGAEIPLERVLNGVNIRANTVGKVGSVAFTIDNKKVAVENVYPYALGGDFPAGNYAATDFIKNPGSYYLGATPFTASGSNGQTGTTLTIYFVVADDQRTVTSPENQIQGLNNDDHRLKLYPNPVSNWLYLESNEFTDRQPEIILTNTLGKTVWTGKLDNAKQVKINLEAMPASLYFMKVNGKAYRVVKQ